MRVHVAALSLLFMLAACGPAGPRAATTPLFKSVKQFNADGTVATLDAKRLTPFQTFLRARLAGGMGPTAEAAAEPRGGWDAFASREGAVEVVELLALEVEVSEGQGREGAYAAIVMLGDARTGKVGEAEFQYYEQARGEPRYDRYFHRKLTAAELAEVQALARAQPVESLRVAPRPAADQGAATEAPLGQAGEAGIGFRFTRATRKEAAAAVIMNPGEEDRPAIEVVRLFSKLRDAPPPSPPLMCRYLRAIPSTAAVLFAHPQNRAVEVGMAGGEVRVRIEPALLGDMREGAHWYARREGTWVEAYAPPHEEATTRAAVPVSTEPAAGGATMPAFPLLPRRPTTSELLARAEARPEPFPREEQWHADPRGGHTVFTHYVPRLANPRVQQAESVQVILPGLEFDTAHMAVDRARGRLYLLHDGHLLGMPLPGVAVAGAGRGSPGTAPASLPRSR